MPWSTIRHLTNNSDSSKQNTSSKSNHFAYNLLSSMPGGGRTPPCFKGIVNHVICSRYPCYSLVPLVVTAAPLGALRVRPGNSGEADADCLMLSPYYNTKLH